MWRHRPLRQLRALHTIWAHPTRGVAVTMDVVAAAHTPVDEHVAVGVRAAGDAALVVVVSEAVPAVEGAITIGAMHVAANAVVASITPPAAA